MTELEEIWGTEYLTKPIGDVRFNSKSLNTIVYLNDGRYAEFKNNTEALEYAQMAMRIASRMRSKKPEIYNKGLEELEIFNSKFSQKK